MKNKEMSNSQRAARAKTACLVYGKDIPESQITDLLSDIRHLCDRLNLDFAKVDKRAYRHYAAEIDAARKARR